MTTDEAIDILYKMESMTAYSGELGGLAVKKAVEALRKQEEQHTAEVNYWNQRGLSLRLEECCLEDLDFCEGDKVKVIIIKEE